MKNKYQKSTQNGSQGVQENTFNGNLTAIPKDMPTANSHADPDLVATPMDFGEMNLEDAIASGYTDKEGNAVSMAKTDSIRTEKPTHEKHP